MTGLIGIRRRKDLSAEESGGKMLQSPFRQPPGKAGPAFPMDRPKEKAARMGRRFVLFNKEQQRDGKGAVGRAPHMAARRGSPCTASAPFYPGSSRTSPSNRTAARSGRLLFWPASGVPRAAFSFVRRRSNESGERFPEWIPPAGRRWGTSAHRWRQKGGCSAPSSPAC